MKKIGLCVCYNTKNFGSQLQVLATGPKIKELGYDTEIIRYQKKLSPTFVAQSLPRFFNPYFIKEKMTAKKRKSELAKHKGSAEKVAMRRKRKAAKQVSRRKAQ